MKTFKLLVVSLAAVLALTFAQSCGSTTMNTDAGTGGGSASTGGGSGSTGGGSASTGGGSGSTGGGSGSTGGGSASTGGGSGSTGGGTATGGGAGGGGGAVNACVAPYSSCTSFTDHTGDGATVSLDLPASAGAGPKCVKINVSQKIQFTNVTGFHPLEQVCGATVLSAATTSPSLVTFTSAGLYGFKCNVHGNTGNMSYAVQVQ